MDGDAADVIADELDLTRMDADPDREADGARGSGHGRPTSDGLRRAVEDGQEAIARRLDLASMEDVEVIAQACVVESQQVLPRVVTESLEGGRRVDDVGEEDRREDPFSRTFGRDTDDPGARPFDRDPRLVADHPGVVARRDLEDRVRRDVEPLAIVHDDVEDPGDGVAQMVHLAAAGSHDRGEIDRPSPSWTPRGPPDGRLVEVDHGRLALRERPHLVRFGECLDLESGHPIAAFLATIDGVVAMRVGA